MTVCFACKMAEEVSFNSFECMHQTTRFYITEDGDQVLVNYMKII